MKRTVNMGDTEPDQKSFKKPSEGQHLFQVVDVYDITNQVGKMDLDENTVYVKLEVAIGEEIGRSILLRLSLDENWKGFFATRLFLKAIGEAHKGKDIEIDTDRWIGRQLYADVIHNGEYANIDSYDFEKCAQLSQPTGNANPGGVTDPSQVAWED